MDRKKFIRNTLLGLAGTVTGGATLKAKNEKENSDNKKKQVGYNHLPNKEEKTMKTVLHKSNTRGHANHGWLNSHHTFSFANYYNPERMHFGILRVLNDDVVAPGKGFGTHPHDNMEIISIPLHGDLEHKDSMGNKVVIKEGDIQAMSAGTGVFHSEYNKNSDKEVKFLQIWLFPREKNIKPRYDQISMQNVARKNEFYQVLSPNADDAGVWIHQDAWFHMADFDSGTVQIYQVKKPGNGVYVFVLEGAAEVEGQLLSVRDGYGLWDTDQFEIKATENARILLMDVPMA